jgi:single-stranded DNA-binding protein
MNRWILTGTVNNQPEVKALQSGATVTSITLDVARDYIAQGATAPAIDSFTCEAWKEVGTNLLAALNGPGVRLMLEGKMSMQTWQGQDGSPRKSMKLTIERFEVIAAAVQAAPVYVPPAPVYTPPPTPAPAQAPVTNWGGAQPAPAQPAPGGWQSPGGAPPANIQDPFADQ